jgi:hypothetical protein
LAKTKTKNLDYSSMKPLHLDCYSCPFPSKRDEGFCSLCVTIVVDKDGKRHFSPEPVLSEEEIAKDKALQKALRGTRARKG